MKKAFALVLALVMAFALVACGQTADSNGNNSTAANIENEVKGEGVMTHAEYVAAELDTEVVVETYIQAKQGWYTDSKTGKEQATFYTQDAEGGYFLYNMGCTEEEYNKLTPGTKVRVTGFKTEWEGEAEIVDATFEILEGNYVAQPADATELLGKDELIDLQNQYVSFKGLTVEPAAEGSDAAFLYKWDGSGSEGDDLYFNVSLNGETYTFTVESYLCGADSDVYKAVKELKVGDKIDVEGFLYWYQGAQPHVVSVAAAQ